MFCQKCGALLQIKKDGNKKIFVCSSCSFKTKNIEMPKIHDKVKSSTRKIETIDDQKELDALPKMDAECPKCGYHKAYFWLIQTRAGDEPETKFMKCEKCKHVWRDYS